MNISGLLKRGLRSEKVPGTARSRSETRWGLLFLSPWIIGFLIFILLPMLATLFISFTNFTIANLDSIEWVGLKNYQRMLRDPLVSHSLGVTLKFFAMAIPLSVMIPLGLAALLNAEHLWFRRLFSTLFYMPYMVPLVSVVLVWGGFLNPQTGWLNRGLAAIGVQGPDWLNSPVWIYPALLIIGLWANGNAILTSLAGMQSIPSEMYDAAKIDGANNVAIFFKITLPLITPIIFYNLTLSVVGLFQYFLEPYVLTTTPGDPGNATLFFNMYLFQNFFKFQDMAYGSTLAWVLFLIILVFTLVLFGTRKYWVFEAESS